MAIEKLRSLEAIAKDISATLKRDIESNIKLGVLFREARDKISANKEFGDWCSENFSGLETRTIKNYQSLAIFEGKKVGNIPLSGLYELGKESNSEVWESVFDDLVTQEKVSVKDVKEAIIAAKSDTVQEIISKFDYLSIVEVREIVDAGQAWIEEHKTLEEAA